MSDISKLLREAATYFEENGFSGALVNKYKRAAELQAAAESLGEPVAWLWDGVGERAVTLDTDEADGMWKPLYLAPQPAVPEGWKLVPVKPTKEMIQAAADLPLRALRGWHDRDCYRVMVAAAPEASYE